MPNTGKKQSHDCQHLQLEFGVGDWVLLSTKHLRMHGGQKLAQRYIGPFVVQERVGAMAYRLALPE